MHSPVEDIFACSYNNQQEYGSQMSRKQCEGRGRRVEGRSDGAVEHRRGGKATGLKVACSGCLRSGDSSIRET